VGKYCGPGDWEMMCQSKLRQYTLVCIGENKIKVDCIVWFAGTGRGGPHPEGSIDLRT